MNTDVALFGRERERETIRSAIAETSQGNCAVVLLSGDAGVGKTALAEECLLECGWMHFTGRAGDSAGPPFAPLISVLRECLRRFGLNSFKKGSLFPYLAHLLPDIPGATPPPDRATLIEAVSELLSSVARREPIAVFLDDLHWSDNATLEILPALVDRARGERILWLATSRSGPAPRGHRLRWAWTELRRRRPMQEILLDSLSREDAGAFLERLLGSRPSPELADRVYRQTGGLPLFLEELSKALIASGSLRRGDRGLEWAEGCNLPIPESVRDAVLCRLESLSAPARELLEAAAVAGVEFSADLLDSVQRDEGAVTELVEQGWLVESDSGRLGFCHALTREAVRSTIGLPRRRSLSSKVAEYLESTGASPEARAEHWLEAGDRRMARRAFQEAAERSCRLHAYWEATRAARQALEAWPEGEELELRLSTLERLAHCAQVSGQLVLATRTWEEVASSVDASADPERHARAQRELAILCGLQGKAAAAATARTAAREGFLRAGKLQEAAVESLSQAGAHIRALQLGQALDAVRETLRLAEETGRTDLQARGLALEATVEAMRGKHREAHKTVQKALAIALEHKHPEVASEVYRRMGSVLEYASDFAGAGTAYAVAIEHCRRRNAEVQSYDCMGCLAYVTFRTGDWKRATEIAREVRKSKEASDLSRASAEGVLGLVHALRGETKQARRAVHLAADIALQRNSLMIGLLTEWVCALIEDLDGASGAAEDRYRRILDVSEETEDGHDVIQPLCWATLFFADGKREQELARCTRALTRIASEAGNPEALAGLALALGETALLQRNAKEATEQLLQALDHLEKLGLPLEQALVGSRAGAAFERAGNSQEALRYLTNGYRLAKKLGARPLAARIAHPLEALGEAPDERRGPERGNQAARGGLTRRQIEILRLIGDGLSNKEIATRLFLSPRTVEMHAARILDRLDCRSRSEAVGKAGRMGIFGQTAL